MAQIPKAFECPLSMDLLEDPVVDPEGYTFSKKEILKALAIKSESPITRKYLTPAMLKPNRAIADAIEEWRNNQTAQQLIQNGQNLNLPVLAPVTVVNPENYKLNIGANYHEDTLCVSVTPQEKGDFIGSDIVCVIDVSGSMSGEVNVKKETGTVERNGLSRLDIVKHAMKTIIKSLSNNDRLAIVKFTTNATTVMKLTNMTPQNQTSAIAKIDALVPENQTNIWDGLKMALDMFSASSNVNTNIRNSAIFLLTDGAPNIEPSRGHIPTLQRYIDKSGLTCCIHTFAFGCDDQLQSTLMRDISKIGLGTYSFIPDASLVGTVFVNCLSNLMITVATNCVVSVTGNNSGINKYVPLGNIQFGQPKNFIVPLAVTGFNNDTKLDIKLSYFSPKLQKKDQLLIEFDIHNTMSDKGLVLTHRVRNELANVVEQAIKEHLDHTNKITIKTYVDTIYKTIQVLTQNNVNNYNNKYIAYLNDLLKDVNGQITEALSRPDYYERWGRHYLPSIVDAHMNQVCKNFKDPGIQHFGGTLFNEVRDKIDDIFNNIPAPTPSIKVSESAYQSGAYTRVASMATYNTASNGCFYFMCPVEMADGTTKPIYHIKKGDYVKTNGNTTAQVLYVTQIPNERLGKFVQVAPRLNITAWHPVKLNGSWVFPASVGESREMYGVAMYNLVLSNGHTVFVDGIECVTLGHGFTDNDVVKHEYFGTQRVIDDIKKLKEENGYVVINDNQFKRDPVTNRVNGISD
ncbi:MAG: putative von willebrand factor type A domain protein [Terrestrivirus sp.]|uniref:Putative von willebrand factor type A domain protein n=1 Tax=Terrestrivirus sp. TaxID=2487775 RepID=A0A3G4ZNZ9_9VIRU|nr:MAG: putative von willebrand factor type A domain protein [Terrestrivirus sp.]